MRCQVCTGCGLCPGVVPERDDRKVRILTGEEGSIASKDDGIRLDGPYRLVACDIGTTTIAMELYGRDGAVEERFVTVNPQVEYGSDVLSRILAARDPKQKKELQNQVKSALIQGMKRFLKCLGPEETPFLVIAANTTMSYLLMGWDCEELGHAPFTASRLGGAWFSLNCETGELKEKSLFDGEKDKAGFAVERNGAWPGNVSGEEEGNFVSCVLLPGISAFVGGDVYSGIRACAMTEREELTLLIDLGTNGEMALGNREKILCTATAAGPAFEGGASRGIWGADMVHFTAMLLERGFADETGLLGEPYFSKGIRIGNVKISQESLRGLQLAKAAIAAGVDILVREYGTSLEKIGRVVLAGGFGYYLHPEDAVRIGMLPETLLERTVAGGNTALLGAKVIGAKLLNHSNVWKNVPIMTMNLAQHSAFADRYVKAMELRPMAQWI